MYLLDTSVVSELRKPKPHGAVLVWVETADPKELYLSAVTIGEIQAGIEMTREQDTTKAQQIERWLDQIAKHYQVLSLDAPCMRIWAQLMHRKSNTLMEDALIAATAKQHGLTVVTRNVADFAALGVEVVNPFVG